MAVQVYIYSKDETKQGFKSASANASAFEASVKKATRSLKLLGVAAVGLGVTAVKQFADFDNRIREISTLLGDVTEKDIKNLGNEIKKTAVTYGQSLDKMAKARYDIISAGFNDAARSALLLEQSAKLAVGGVSDVSTTADVLTTVLNAYGLEAEKAAYVSDQLFTTVRLGKTTINELASQFGEVASIAPQVGVSIKELSAMFATLTAAGQNTAVAGTAINAAMVAFLSPSEAMTKRLSEMGFATGSAAIKALGFQEALRRVTDGANEAEQAAIFPNVRAMRSVFPLVGTQAEKFASNLNELSSTSGATDTAVAKMAKGTKFQIEQMKTKINAYLVDMGEQLIRVTNAFLELPNGIKNAAAAVVIFGTAVYAVGAPVAAIVSAAYLLYRNWDFVISSIIYTFDEWYDKIKFVAENLWNAFKTPIEKVVSAITNAAKVLGYFVTLEFDKAREANAQIKKDWEQSDKDYISNSEQLYDDYWETRIRKMQEFNQKAAAMPSALPNIFPDIGGGTTTSTNNGGGENTKIDRAQTEADMMVEITRNSFDLQREIATEYRDEEIANMEMMKDVQIGYTQEMLQNEIAAFRERNVLWRSASSAYDTFVGTILDSEMTGKKRRELIWRSIKQTFINTIAEQLKEYIATAIIKDRFAKAGMTSTVIAGTGTAAALSAAYATPAALASVMSFGGAAATGSAALAGAVSASRSLAALPLQSGSTYVSNGAFSGTDTIPAILTKGEAVIPANVVRENTTIINQLVGGQAPSVGGSNREINLNVQPVFHITAVDAKGTYEVVQSEEFKRAFIDLINNAKIILNNVDQGFVQ